MLMFVSQPILSVSCMPPPRSLCINLLCDVTADDDPPAVSSPRRTRRSSRKSSVVEPMDSAAAAATHDSSAQPAIRRPRSRSSARTSSKAPTAEPAPVTPSNGSSRVKSLAQQLAKKALSIETAATVAPVAAAAAGIAAPEAEPVSSAPSERTDVDNTDMLAYDQFYAGSQAQSDSILMEGRANKVRVQVLLMVGRDVRCCALIYRHVFLMNNKIACLRMYWMSLNKDCTSSRHMVLYVVCCVQSSYDNATATYEEVIAQVSAEGQAGLADEPQLAVPADMEVQMLSASLATEQVAQVGCKPALTLLLLLVPLTALHLSLL